jgi:Flp pilus assembly protein TadG
MIRRRAAASHRDQRGAALVEFALVLPILMALLLGITTGGIAVYQKITLSGAAREGARFGAVLPTTQCTPADRCGGSTWAQYVRAEVVANSAGSLTADQVCVALVSGTGAQAAAIGTGFTTAGGTSSCTTDSSTTTGRRVQVTVTKPAEIQAIITTQTISLTSTAVSRYEQ